MSVIESNKAACIMHIGKKHEYGNIKIVETTSPFVACIVVAYTVGHESGDYYRVTDRLAVFRVTRNGVSCTNDIIV